MAKKKNQGKKHKFKHVAPVGAGSSNEVNQSASSPSLSEQPRTSAPVARRVQNAAVASARDFSYVPKDLKRIAMFAACLVGLEVVLWYVFGHTSIGPAVYQSIKV